MQAHTEINAITFDPHGRGHVFVEFAKIVRNGDAVLSRSYHRHMFAPGVDVAAELDPVNTSLSGEGFPDVGAADIEMILAIAAVQWTPERIAAWQAELADLAGDTLGSGGLTR